MRHNQLTTTTRGSQRESYSIRLFEKSKNWGVFDDQFNSMLAPAIGVNLDLFAAYEPVPFRLFEDDLVNFACGQFTKRLEQLNRNVENKTIDLEMLLVDNGV